MTNALNKMLSESGLDKTDKKAAKKKTDMVSVIAPNDVQKKVDRWLELDEEQKNAKAEMEIVSQSLRDFSTEYIVKNHETENLILTGTKGQVNVNFKDQYNVVSDEEQHKAIVNFLEKRKIDPARCIEESSTVSFDFNALTSDERKKLMNFLTKELGAERYGQVVATKTVYKLSNLKDEMIKKVKSVKEFQEFRELTAHYNATIAKRNTK